MSGNFCGGKNVTIYDSTTVTGDVEIGDNTWIGPFCSIDGTGKLSIGKYCSISAGTHIQSHDTVKWALSGGKASYEYGIVKSGNYCFIGVNAVITRGVTIGDHCLIAAGSVVAKNVPNNTIVGGVPARRIGSIVVKDEDVNLSFDNSPSKLR